MYCASTKTNSLFFKKKKTTKISYFYASKTLPPYLLKKMDKHKKTYKLQQNSNKLHQIRANQVFRGEKISTKTVKLTKTWGEKLNSKMDFGKMYPRPPNFARWDSETWEIGEIYWAGWVSQVRLNLWMALRRFLRPETLENCKSIFGIPHSAT